MLGERPLPKQGAQRGAKGGLPEQPDPSPTSTGCPATARTTRRVLSFISTMVCICGTYMPTFLMDLGQVGLKVSSASPHSSLCFLVPAISCASREQLGKQNRQGKEQLGPAPTSPRELLVLEHHLQLQSAEGNLFAQSLY